MKKTTSTTILFLALFPLSITISATIQPIESFYYFTFSLRYIVFCVALGTWSSVSGWAAKTILTLQKNQTMSLGDLTQFVENKKWWMASGMVLIENLTQILNFRG